MPEEIKKRAMDRRRFIQVVSGGALTATTGGLIGCGGTNTAAVSGGSGGAGGTGDLGLGTISPQAAAAAIDSVRSFAGELPVLDLATARQRVVEHIRSEKTFVHSGINEGSVWGLLPDGTTYTVFLNRYPQPGENSGPDSGRAATTRGSNVPSGTLSAVMLNGMGAAFRNEPAVLRPSVNEKQYAVRVGDADIESLRNLGGPGFFYLSAHGDQTDVPRIVNGKFVLGSDGKPIMDKAFAVSTTTPYNAATRSQYTPEILRGEVAAGSCLEDIKGGRGIYADRLLITTRWVSRYWTFSRDSLIWISACSSNGAISQDFVRACQAKAGNAALYVGWSDITEGDHAFQVSKFVIDRLLGTNKLSPKEDPPQRSFDFVKVYEDLRKRGLHSRPTQNPATGAAFVGRTTEVIFTQGAASQFGLLAPSLAYVLVDETNDEAILKGIFGTPPESDRAVLIGGIEVTVKSWAEDKIVVALPRTGTGSSGDVVVSVRAHQSNVRRITEWEFTLRYLWKFDDKPPLTVRASNLKVRFRADVGEYRTQPGADPRQPIRGANATNDSGGDMEANGLHIQGDCTETWSGNVTLSSQWSNEGGPYKLLAVLRVDTKTKQGALGLAYGSLVQQWFTSKVECPMQPTVTNSFAVSAGLLNGVEQFPDPTETVNTSIPVSSIPLSFGQRYALPAGVLETNNDGLRIRFEWDAVTPKSPPDEDAARSASRG